MGDAIVHWNDFFLAIAIITGVVMFFLACRYGVMYEDSNYNAANARKVITAFLIVFTLSAAFALGIK